MELDVAGAFHSPMMEPAVAEFSAALGRTEFTEPEVPVFSAVTVQPFSEPRRELADALTHPVRWRETMLALHERGATKFVEVGPGRVLTGLAKRTLKGVELAGV
jgi:malonyl CoA-acyl carrier protein transacylase